MTKLLCAFLLLVCSSDLLTAQMADPVKWQFSSEALGGSEYLLTFKADVETGWFIYSQHLDEGGPIPTTFEFEKQTGVELLGALSETGKRKEGYDELFDMNIVKFGGETIFQQKIKVNETVANVKGYLTFMTCNHETCLPPVDVDFSFDLQ